LMLMALEMIPMMEKAAEEGKTNEEHSPARTAASLGRNSRLLLLVTRVLPSNYGHSSCGAIAILHCRGNAYRKANEPIMVEVTSAAPTKYCKR